MIGKSSVAARVHDVNHKDSLSSIMPWQSPPVPLFVLDLGLVHIQPGLVLMRAVTKEVGNHVP